MPVVHQDIAVLVVIFIQSLSPAAVSADLMSDRVSVLLSEHCCTGCWVYWRPAIRGQHKGCRYPSWTNGNGEICWRQLQKYLLLPAGTFFLTSFPQLPVHSMFRTLSLASFL